MFRPAKTHEKQPEFTQPLGDVFSHLPRLLDREL
jgi:hypothetical protein